jgi:hypothetical protein
LGNNAGIPVMKKFILLFLLFLSTNIYTQEQYSYYRTILLSFKTGYHTGSDLNSDQGFPAGMVWDGAVDFGMSPLFLIGINFEYWKRDNVVVNPYLTNITYQKDYDSFGYKVHFQFRKNFRDKADIYADVGLGRYRISYEKEYVSYEDDYLSAGLSLGGGVKLHKQLWIHGEFSLYGLIKPFNDHSSGLSVINFKIGPTLFFRLN